jgi:chromosome segregation ATPase
LIEKYEKKLKDLKEELELRMKVEIHEIEERKNQHINELMKNHEEAFREMKEYHNDITRENLELIRMSREKLFEIRNQILTNQQMVEQLREKKEKLEGPLQNATNERDTLKRQLANYDKDVMALRNAKARL